MNRSQQLEAHPETESLSAFLENRVSEPEHRQILAHLAACPRCRQIVYLAQQAAEPLAPSPAPQPSHLDPARTHARFPSWFAGWRLAGAAAAACIALAALTMVLYPRLFPARTPPAGQMARATIAPEPATASSPPASLDSLSQPTRPARPNSPPQALPPPSQPLRPAESAANPSPASGSPAAPHPAIASAAPAPAAAPAPQLPESAAQAVKVISANEAATLQTPPIETANRQQVVSARQAAAPLPNQKALVVDPASRPRAVAGLSARVGAQMSASDASPAAPAPSKAAPAAPEAASAKASLSPPAAADRSAAQKWLGTILPSGSAAVSTALNQNRLLALDAKGALFLSLDEGKSWNAIAPPWPGRATSVFSPPDPRLAAAWAFMKRGPVAYARRAASAGAPQPAHPALPLFAIVTDAGATWTSADGKTWIEQPASSPSQK